MKDAILRIFLIFSVLFSSAQYKEWEDLSTFKINTEEPHSFFIPKDINGDSITKYLNGILLKWMLVIYWFLIGNVLTNLEKIYPLIVE